MPYVSDGYVLCVTRFTPRSVGRAVGVGVGGGGAVQADKISSNKRQRPMTKHRAENRSGFGRENEGVMMRWEIKIDLVVLADGLGAGG